VPTYIVIPITSAVKPPSGITYAVGHAKVVAYKLSESGITSGDMLRNWRIMPGPIG